MGFFQKSNSGIHFNQTTERYNEKKKKEKLLLLIALLVSMISLESRKRESLIFFLLG